MSNERVTELPAAINANLTDIIYAVQGFINPSILGTSVQMNLQQVANLMLSQNVLSFPGNPNGLVAGKTYQLLWDTVNLELWICTTTGNAISAVWTLITSSLGTLVTPPHGGTGVASPTAHTLPVAEGAANFNFLGPLTNGQLLIGSTGADPVPATLTAGANITIGNAPGAITIAATGGVGFTWNDVVGASASMASFNGYVADNGGLVTLTLPVASSFGDELQVICRQGSFTIVENLGQYIVFGTSTTTTTTGSLTSTNAGDALTLICTSANVEWTVTSSIGILTVV